MAGEPQVDGRLEEGVGCSEGRLGIQVWGALGVVGWWEGKGWLWKGVEVVVKGSGGSDAVARASTGLGLQCLV